MRKFELTESRSFLACCYPKLELFFLNKEAKRFVAELILHELSEQSISNVVWNCEPNFPRDELVKISHNVNSESLGEVEYLRADLANKYIESDRLSDISENPNERETFKYALHKLRKQLYK